MTGTNRQPAHRPDRAAERRAQGVSEAQALATKASPANRSLAELAVKTRERSDVQDVQEVMRVLRG